MTAVKNRTHGGARAGAGRPAKTRSRRTEPVRRLGDPLRTSAATRPIPSGSNERIAPFFGPYNTNHPVPLGNGSMVPPQTSHTSFWAGVGASRSEAAALNSGQEDLPNSGATSGTSNYLVLSNPSHINTLK